MDKFDQLSNNELRDQLKSLGLGNFPVTDKTRNSLIKKLRNAVNGPAKPAAKQRRETMNVVVKSVSPDESESDADAKKPAKIKSTTNRRATIAAAAPLKPAADIPNGVSNDKVIPPRPKSPSRQKPAARRSMAPEIPYFADASDDDSVAAAEEAERRVSRKTRTSHSPSLSKSSVVTTSYKHTIEPLIEYNDDVILLNDNSDVEYNTGMLDKVRKPTPTTKITADAESRRKTLQVGPSVSTNYASIKPIEKPISYEDSSSAYRRRHTTYASPPQNQNIKDSTDDVLNGVETPFLSDFTRRLAQLKAEQLPGADLGTNYRTPTRSTSSEYLKQYRSSAYGTAGSSYRPKTTLQAQNTESKWSAIEKQIRMPLLVFLTLLVAVFVYVFFFSSDY